VQKVLNNEAWYKEQYKDLPSLPVDLGTGSVNSPVEQVADSSFSQPTIRQEEQFPSLNIAMEEDGEESRVRCSPLSFFFYLFSFAPG